MSKPKKLAYQIISTNDEPELYALMEELIDEFHDHLIGAKIALAWCHSWKPDPDGILTLGKCKKAADLDRQLHNRDFVILLNHAVWTVAEFTDEQKRALLDHELCHADIALDSEGESQVTADGRTVYRIKKHDLEEFQCIVERHGCWKKHIEEFARAALERGRSPLFASDEGDDDTKVSISLGGEPPIELGTMKEATRKMRRAAAAVTH